MQVVIDIECNSLFNPTKVWLIVCKDIDTNEYYIFRNLTSDENEKSKFLAFTGRVDRWIGHNILEYDFPVLHKLGIYQQGSTSSDVIDTLILSRLVDYPRASHSIEAYGLEFELPKGDFSDWTQYSPAMEEYCRRDVDICQRVYAKYRKVIQDPAWQKAIRLEHDFQTHVVNKLQDNGFAFNTKKAKDLLEKVTKELEILDEAILKEFPPKLKFIKEVNPKLTKHGTISRSSIPRSLGDDLSLFTEDAPFCHCKWEEFNPSSHKQIVKVLSQSGWNPIEKTKTHIETERRLNQLKRERNRSNEFDLEFKKVYDAYNKLQETGWKVNEENIDTLPPTAPSSARTLAKRILYESRRRTLTEWLGLVRPDTNRIHGKYLGIGTWTHRMAHRQPNTANIPNELDTAGNKKLLGKELRSLWRAPTNRLLVGVDAEGIQLRIFAHYIDDKEFTRALVEGKKDDKTDPHSLNQRILGSVCKSRAAAKRFIYALLLGAGIGKLAQILECSVPEAEEALDRLLHRYSGFAFLKQTIIPKDAKKGSFIGLDGRKVRIPGDEVGSRRHLAMSGYLQNGEAVCMKMATLLWMQKLDTIKADYKLVNLVHDEWQTETPNNMEIALEVARIQADSLRIVGEELGLRCPLAGSYYNDDLKDHTIGPHWGVTH